MSVHPTGMPYPVSPAPVQQFAAPQPLPEKPSLPSDGSAGDSGRPPLRVGLKLEADDRRFPYYVCVATIEDMRSE